jgi:hypothetical protein
MALVENGAHIGLRQRAKIKKMARTHSGHAARVAFDRLRLTLMVAPCPLFGVTLSLS